MAHRSEQVRAGQRSKTVRAIPLMLVLSPALASAFHMPAAVSMTRSCMHALGSRPHMARDGRQTVRSSVLALRAQMPPPPPETGSRTLSKAEMADLNIQLLEAGQYLSWPGEL